MVTTEHDPRAWRVATALAHESGLDWALWARGGEHVFADDNDGWWRCVHCKVSAAAGPDDVTPPCSSPVPAPWDTEAYLADCRRRGVEPGPLPSLDFNQQEADAISGEVRWAVYDSEVIIEVGAVTLFVKCPWSRFFPDKVAGGAKRHATIDDLVRATNLARVAAEAMRHG